ncbi:MAG: L-2-hydroxyglutarate oxidase [Bryobacterales bacterium]|nr:L-2-hydroxyglutarate oxidase [Bryobacterales bacterium]
MGQQSFLIVGGGIVGLATALRLLEKEPRASVTVLEKEKQVGQHQTGNNSGVLHAGLYYKPGSLKARLAVQGIRQMVRFCQENSVPHEICGKVVVATAEEELGRLNDLYERGQQNGLANLRLLNKEEIREIEPHAAGIRAVRVPEEGIVDYAQVCARMVDHITRRGGRVVTQARVAAIRPIGAEFVAETTAGEFRGGFIINCAGLHSDRVAELGTGQRGVRIVPFRGEYFKLRPERQHLVRHLIYPVPDPKFPFLGVHFTRLIHGGVECGPNAVLAFKREGYTKKDISLADLWDIFSFPGFWKFLMKYPSVSWHELRRSFSKRLFCESLQRLVPEVRQEDLTTGGAGVRAQAMAPDGALLQDFHFVHAPRQLHVVNAPSPGATASLAIGEEIVRELNAKGGL